MSSFISFPMSLESHFQLEVMAHVRLLLIFTAQYLAYEILDFIHFKAPVTSFDICEWFQHYYWMAKVPLYSNMRKSQQTELYLSSESGEGIRLHIVTQPQVEIFIRNSMTGKPAFLASQKFLQISLHIYCYESFALVSVN